MTFQLILLSQLVPLGQYNFDTKIGRGQTKKGE